MKFKGLTKLAMSGVALAAVAATLGTSTYAWYVTNSKAVASNIEAKTRDNDGSNLLVSKDGSNFSSKVVFSSTGEHVGYLKMGTLDPVTTTDATSFIEYAEDGTTTTASEKYVQVEYWLRSSDAVTVVTTLAVENTTESLPVQKIYYQTGGVTTNTITVDAVKALRTSFAVDSGNATIYATDSIATQTDYETPYAAKSGSFTNPSQATVQIDDADGGDSAYSATGAHAYYAAVMRHAPGKVADNASDKTSIDTIALAADTPVHVVMTIWLEGADTLCFDACGGQTFEFSLQFTKSSSNSSNTGD